MKYCSKCGAEMLDEAVICIKCQNPVEGNTMFNYQTQTINPTTSGTITATKVFMIIGAVLMVLYTFGIGLAWCIPMTISYFNKTKKGKPIGTGFTVCTMLFVSFIAGILMLGDNRK